jgi:hypothetical protein
MAPPNDIDSAIRARVDAFVNDLGNLVRAAAVQAVRGALGDGSAAPRRRGRPRKAAPVLGGIARRAAPIAGRRGRRGRRSPEAVGETADVVRAHVRAHPGQRLEEMGRELGVPTSDLKLPISKLLAGGELRTEGQKRGTRYFAARGSASRPPASPRAGAAMKTGQRKRRTAKRPGRKARRAAKRKTRRGTRAGQPAAAPAG